MRIAALSKPQEVVPKALVELEEKDDVLYVRTVQQPQAKVEENTSERLPVPVQTNLEKAYSGSA